jgi:hypothetical protein
MRLASISAGRPCFIVPVMRVAKDRTCTRAKETRDGTDIAARMHNKRDEDIGRRVGNQSACLPWLDYKIAQPQHG